MSLLRTEAALAAALLAAGCATAAGGPRSGQAAEADGLRAEVAELRAENQQLARAVEALAARMDVVTARLTKTTVGPRSAEALPAPLVPEGLAVIRVEPTRAGPTRVQASEPGREGSRAKRAPAVATAVPITEPDPGTLSGLARQSGRELAAEADAELRAARKKGGVARAHALEDFATRYPRHPLADDALLEASGAYAEAGLSDAVCSLARRIADEYPAGDALAEALWGLVECESRAGFSEAERLLLHRLVTEFPSSAAARRAGERLAVITGRAAVASPSASPARSGP